MMKSWQRRMGMAACLGVCMACSTDPEGDWRYDELGGVPGTLGITEEGSGSGTGTGMAGTLLDFDITWDDVADDAFADTKETVPTDENDEEYDDYLQNSTFSVPIQIAYGEGSATVTGSADGVDVTVNGADVVVESSVKKVEYILTGATSDGSFKINSSNKFQLTLKGVSLTSAKGAAINIQSKKRVFVEVAEGTENMLADAKEYTNMVEGEDQKACFFSEAQLIFSGSGSLVVSGNYKHGICSDDYVFLHSGTNITVASAVKDAIHANDKIVMNGGLLKLTPSGDGLDCEEGLIDIRGGLLKAKITGSACKALKSAADMTISGGQQILLVNGDAEYDSGDKDISSPAGIKCDGNFTMRNASLSVKSTGAAGKGINCDGTLTVESGTLKVITTGKQYVYGRLDSSAKGIKADGDLTVVGGTIWVRTSGGEGSEGIESKSTLSVTDGEIGVYAYDDCMNASKNIVIGGGRIYCYSINNDGIDSNGTLTVTGGTVVASGTTSPEEGIDCDQNTFKITGGILLGIGGATSTPTSNVCTQRSVIYSGSGSNGAMFSIAASDGTHVMSYTLPRNYSQMTVLFSSPALASGGSYVIYSGGSVTGGTSFCGLTTGGAYTVGTSVGSFAASNMVTSVGNSSFGGGGGMFPGGGGWR